MSGTLRVVFDTSTLVGVALKVGSVPHRTLDWALQQCNDYWPAKPSKLYPVGTVSLGAVLAQPTIATILQVRQAASITSQSRGQMSTYFVTGSNAAARVLPSLN